MKNIKIKKLNEWYIHYLLFGIGENKNRSFFNIRNNGYYYDNGWKHDTELIRDFEKEWKEFQAYADKSLDLLKIKEQQAFLKEKQQELPMNKEHKKLLHELKLKKWAENNPNFPQTHIPKTVYKDSTANGLTKAIIDYITLHGYQAERINTMGVARTKYRTDGSVAGVQWTKGTGTPGSADISATIKGRSVKIEVKIGKDRQSDAQKRYQEKIEQAGGVYYIARNFDEFVIFFNEIVNC